MAKVKGCNLNSVSFSRADGAQGPYAGKTKLSITASKASTKASGGGKASTPVGPIAKGTGKPSWPKKFGTA